MYGREDINGQRIFINVFIFKNNKVFKYIKVCCIDLYYYILTKY